MTCRHPRREPVRVVLTEELVGQVCVDCWEALPVEWGCPGCTWARIGVLGHPELRLQLVERCDNH